MPDLNKLVHVQYVAGKTFKSEFGTHLAGDIVEEADQFPNTQVLVDAGFLWPYAPDDGLDYIPVNLYPNIQSREAVMAKLELQRFPNREQFPSGKPEVVQQAEAEANLQTRAYEQARRGARQEQEDPEEPLQDPAPGYESPEEVEYDPEEPQEENEPESDVQSDSEPVEESAPEEENAEEEPEPFDPADYGVELVNEYLDDADEEERERVLQAEREGKNRKGILGD